MEEGQAYMDKKKLAVLYALTYIVIVLVRRLAFHASWTDAFVGGFSLLYLALAATSFILYPALQRGFSKRNS